MGKFIDLTGQRFGKLTVVKINKIIKVKHGTVIMWECKCDCENIVFFSTGELRRGNAKHCGCLKVKNIIGQKFGRLIVIKRVKNNIHQNSQWLCKCDCGKEIVVSGNHLKTKHTQSCGCLAKEISEKRMFKHGLSKNKDFYRLMHIRKGMKLRCYNTKNPNYKNYGGRGIIICEEWLDKENGALNFYNWSMANGYKDNLTIDRIDNNGNYEPNNCRWVTMKEQDNNKRNNHYITYNGETHTLKEWSNILKIDRSSIYRRIKRNIPEEFLLYNGRLTLKFIEEYKNNEIK